MSCFSGIAMALQKCAGAMALWSYGTLKCAGAMALWSANPLGQLDISTMVSRIFYGSVLSRPVCTTLVVEGVVGVLFAIR